MHHSFDHSFTHSLINSSVSGWLLTTNDVACCILDLEKSNINEIQPLSYSSLLLKVATYPYWFICRTYNGPFNKTYYISFAVGRDLSGLMSHLRVSALGLSAASQLQTTGQSSSYRVNNSSLTTHVQACTCQQCSSSVSKYIRGRWGSWPWELPFSPHLTIKLYSLLKTKGSAPAPFSFWEPGDAWWRTFGLWHSCSRG